MLALGLALTAGSLIAGEEILGWLGLLSGVIVVAVGVGMIAGVLDRRRSGAGRERPHGHRHTHAGTHPHAHPHGPHDNSDHSGHHHSGHRHGPRGRRGRLSLAGIGLAGGLVPSPSTLVVLLAAIGLGRTGLDILLVVAYGAGMAATLAGAGLLLVALQRRLARTPTRVRFGSRLTTVAGRLRAATPTHTATPVLVVGAGLAARAALAVL